MNTPIIATTKTMQDAADSAYARFIWWEATKLIAPMVLKDIRPSSEDGVNFAREVTRDFIQLCHQGFFDVTRKTEDK